MAQKILRSAPLQPLKAWVYFTYKYNKPSSRRPSPGR